MGIIAGIGAAVTGLPCTTRWQFEETTNSPEGVCSASAGGPIRRAGNVDYKGQTVSYGVAPPTGYLVGDTFRFLAGTSGSKGIDTGVAGSIVTRTDVFWDQSKGGYIYFANQFASANGTLDYGTAAAADTANPTGKVSRSCKAGFGAAGATELTDLTKMHLVMVNKARPYVTSSTAGLVKRVAGNFDAFFEVTALIDDPLDATIPVKNSENIVKLYTDATYFWELKWMYITHVGEALEIEGSGYYTKVIKGAFSANDGSGDGHVKTPGVSPLYVFGSA